MRPRARRFLVHAAAVALAGSLSAPAATPEAAKIPSDRPATLADCDAKVAADHDALASYRCYWFVARNGALWDEATRRLEAILRREPDNAHARLILGAIAADRGEARAAPLLGEAAAQYARRGAVEEEVRARTTLGVHQRRQGRLDDAAAELGRALARAAGSARADLAAEVRIQLGWQAYYARDYGAAAQAFAQAEATVFPSGSIFHRLDTIDGLAATAWALGRPELALGHYARQIELLGGSDPYRAAFVRRNALLVLREMVDAGERDEEDLVAAAREALDAAQRAGNRLAETGARLVLAERVPAGEAITQARAALDLARATSQPAGTVWALRVLAERAVGPDPARRVQARAWLAEALAIAQDHGDAESRAAVQAGFARVAWRADDRPSALAATLAALDAAERVRDLQPERETRARVFGRFADLHREAVDRILSTAGTPPGQDDVARAFAVAERMRARALLDTLDAAAAASPRGAAAALAGERREVLAAISSTMSRLAAAELPPLQRAALRADLDAQERRERALADAIARADPGTATLRRPEIPALDAVRTAVAPDQALLLFVLPRAMDAHTQRGWVFVVTAGRALALPIDDPGHAAREARLFVALLARADGSEQAGGERLFARLLRPALESLPASVVQLVIVPDGALHGLPFDALRATRDAPYLAERYIVSLAPSAATWLRLARRAAPSPPSPPSPLLSFADPAVPGTPIDGVPVGALPYARREARRLAHALGGATRVLAGAEASERALRRAGVERYAVLHFAAHGVTDGARPERSAILLAPDGEDDGVLQYREIVELPLRNPTVILSTCVSASGPVVGGEGAMALSAAFLHAGARAVVASPWLLPDAEASAFIDAFGRGLARGETAGAALAAARRDAIRRGTAPAAWAAFSLFGDAGVIPHPGVADRSGRALAIATMLGVALCAALLALRRRRIRRRRS